MIYKVDLVIYKWRNHWFNVIIWVLTILLQLFPEILIRCRHFSIVICSIVGLTVILIDFCKIISTFSTFSFALRSSWLLTMLTWTSHIDQQWLSSIFCFPLLTNTSLSTSYCHTFPDIQLLFSRLWGPPRPSLNYCLAPQANLLSLDLINEET